MTAEEFLGIWFNWLPVALIIALLLDAYLNKKYGNDDPWSAVGMIVIFIFWPLLAVMAIIALAFMSTRYVTKSIVHILFWIANKITGG